MAGAWGLSYSQRAITGEPALDQPCDVPRLAAQIPAQPDGVEQRLRLVGALLASAG